MDAQWWYHLLSCSYIESPVVFFFTEPNVLVLHQKHTFLYWKIGWTGSGVIALENGFHSFLCQLNEKHWVDIGMKNSLSGESRANEEKMKNCANRVPSVLWWSERFWLVDETWTEWLFHFNEIWRLLFPFLRTHIWTLISSIYHKHTLTFLTEKRMWFRDQRWGCFDWCRVFIGTVCILSAPDYQEFFLWSEASAEIVTSARCFMSHLQHHSKTTQSKRR